MSEKITKVPAIRFKGFTDPWEQCELSKILKERNEQLSENDEYPLMSFVQGIGVTPKGDRYDRSFLVKEDKKKYKKTELGDFIYSSNNLETGSIGFNKTGKAVISPVYSIFSSKNELESKLIGILSTRKDFIAKMIKYRQGVVYGQWRIHENEFLKIVINVPDSKEQKKIIDTFSQLDNLITLQQRELDLMKKQKQTLLSKMFPKTGDQFPEIRFKGFTDPWEQRKVTELGKVFIGLVTTMTKYYTDEGTLLIRNSDIKDGRFEFSDQPIYLKKSFAQKNTSRMHQVGDVITVHTGDVGTSAVITKNEVNSIGFATIVTRPNAKILNSDYLSTFLNTDKHKRWAVSVSTGDGRTNYNLGDYNELFVPKPLIDEQIQISSIFKSLNNLITLQQRKLDQMKIMKKSLLKVMFV